MNQNPHTSNAEDFVLYVRYYYSNQLLPSDYKLYELKS